MSTEVAEAVAVVRVVIGTADVKVVVAVGIEILEDGAAQEVATDIKREAAAQQVVTEDVGGRAAVEAEAVQEAQDVKALTTEELDGKEKVIVVAQAQLSKKGKKMWREEMAVEAQLISIWKEEN